METIKLIIADDHRLVRDGLKSLLNSEADIEIVAEVENGLELLEILPSTPAQVVLLDVTMPKMNGIQTAIEIKKQNFDINIVFLSMHEEPEYLLNCVQAGAYSYLFKNVEKDELLVAIRNAALGKKYFSPIVSALLAQALVELKDNEKEKIDLTPRELEVLQYVADGLSTKQLADKLFISVRTVETHRMNLLKKFEAQNTAELIKSAIERKLLNEK
ncbi:MAG: response regulator [Cytophagales bacterium]